jgi:hypothetical protein
MDCADPAGIDLALEALQACPRIATSPEDPP